MNIVLKPKRGNEKQHPHIDVYAEGVLIGYITAPKVNVVDGLWHFTPKIKGLSPLTARTKTSLLSKIGQAKRG